MVSPLLLVILVVGSAIRAVAQPDLTVCNPTNYTFPYDGPPIPKLPNQYRLKVEANIGNHGYSMLLDEYYDEINNRGSTYSVYGNLTYFTAYDYRLNQTVRAQLNDNFEPVNCIVGDLTKGFSIYGFHVENGTGHINGTDTVFQFGSEFNETYIGMESVRGVPTNHWQRCVYHEAYNTTYLLDYFFSAPGYKMPYDASEVPMRAMVNGSSYNGTTGERHTFSNNYDIFDMKPGPLDYERIFEPPLGVVCPGYKRVKAFPDFTDVFSVDVESVIPKYHVTHFTREHYSYKAKLVAYMYQPWGKDQNGTTIREVHDFNAGLSYKINYDTEKCSVGPIPVHSFFRDAESLDGKHVSLRSPYSFILHDNSNWIYEGSTTIRDIEAEAWITQSSHSNGTHTWNGTMEYFFARGNWSGDSSHGNRVHQMPLKLNYQGKWMENGVEHHWEMHQSMFHFSYFIPGFVFDVHACFDESDSKYASVDILGQDNYENYVVNNSHTFYSAAQHALANASGLPASRIANVYAVEGDEDILTIYFEMLGLPKVQGNAVNVTTQPSLGDAVAKLEERVLDASNLLTIEFTKDGKEVILAVYPASLKFDFHREEHETHEGLSVGAAAGLAIGMLLLGVALATIIAVFYIRRVMAPPVPYGVQS
ncbi:uncharacterized protein [Diadema antillarum]|uniref:uncharacterized protein n=1 Tax=Diadema antillarum TaxID=105358 RepID=UPI003A8B58DD